METQPASAATRPPRVLFVVTEDWYFLSHRLQLATRIQNDGFEVAVATHKQSAFEPIADAGIELFNIPFERSLRHPLADFRALLALRAAMREWQPDIVHLVSLKPIILGALAARSVRLDAVGIWAFTGMGFLFSSSRLLARILKPLVLALIRSLYRRGRDAAIVQNDEDGSVVDGEILRGSGSVSLIRGAGVDCSIFHPPAPPTQTDDANPIVLLPARLLHDKGVCEFVDAARELKSHSSNPRFVIVGMIDEANHGAIDEQRVTQWVDENIVEWWGHRDDMAAVIRDAAVVCLPSYREGLPKALLEAAACGRPMIATDVAGCRDVCRHDQTGLLVPLKNSAALAAAIRKLLNDSAQRDRMGRAARELAENEFSIELVASQTTALYRRMTSRNEALR